MAQDKTQTGRLDIDWDDDTAALKFATECESDKRTHNEDFERQAEMNAAWCGGDQCLFWSKAQGGRLVPQANPRGRVRLMMNVLRPHVEAVTARMGSLPSRLAARPATGDLADYDAAVAQTQLLKHYQEKFGWDSLVEMWDRQAVICAETFAKVTWDAEAGDALPALPGGEIGFDDDGLAKRYGDQVVELAGGMKGVGGLATGDVRVERLSVHQVFWGPVGVEFEAADWVVEIRERGRDYVRERYGRDAAKAAGAYSEGQQTWRRGEYGPQGSRVQTADGDALRVLTAWVRRSAQTSGLENGRHIVIVGDQVVKNGPNPYRHGEIPIARFALLEAATGPRGETFVTDALPLQRDINQAVSQAVENREWCCNPPTYVPESAIVDRAEWDNRIGGVRRIRGGTMPVTPTIPPNYRAAQATVADNVRAIQELFGVREVSQGKNPAGVRSGTAVSLLQQADDERLGPITRSRKAFLQRIGRLMLATARQYMTEARRIRIHGEESATRTRRLEAGMLGGDGGAADYDVTFDVDAPPRSRGAIRADINALASMRFLSPENPDHVDYVMQALQLGQVRRGADRSEAARQMQHERNRMMARGEYTPPAPWEDHQTLMSEMRRFQHAPFFRELPDEIQGLFVQYEEECLKHQALRKPYQEAIAQAALREAGVLPPPPAAAPAEAVAR